LNVEQKGIRTYVEQKV